VNEERGMKYDCFLEEKFMIVAFAGASFLLVDWRKTEPQVSELVLRS